MKFKIFSILLSTLLLFPLSSSAEQNISVYGLTTTGALVKFQSNTPGTIESSVAITGLQSGESLVGIDMRPADGLLYGVGSTSRLYKIDPATGVATGIGGQFTTTLTGSAFGVDFNPSVDRLRIVGNDRQNIRVNPADGSFVALDTPLAFGVNDPNSAATPNVIGVAYSNNQAAVASTTLMGIDATLGILTRIGGPNSNPSPNGGEVTSLGSLGISTNLSNIGFDIVEAKTVGSEVAILSATLNGESTSKIFSVDLAGGSASLLGTVGNGLVLSDIAGSISDIVAPIGLISAVQRVRIGDFGRRGTTVYYSCSEMCTVTATLAFVDNAARRLGLSTNTIATASGNLADAGVATLSFTPPGQVTSALAAAANRGERRFRTQLTLVITDAGGNSTTLSSFIETTA